jgi:hypothetical protein
MDWHAMVFAGRVSRFVLRAEFGIELMCPLEIARRRGVILHRSMGETPIVESETGLRIHLSRSVTLCAGSFHRSIFAMRVGASGVNVGYLRIQFNRGGEVTDRALHVVHHQPGCTPLMVGGCSKTFEAEDPGEIGHGSGKIPG